MNVRVDGCVVAFEGESYRYVVVEHKFERQWAGLTAAEADVARRAARGESSQGIAAARRTSQRTVDNQLASIYRKLGIASRNELSALLADE